MQKRQNLGCIVRQDVARKRRECRRTRAPRVHDGGHPCAHSREVRLHAGFVHTLEDMCMQIDQARRHGPARNVDHPLRASRIDLRRHLRNVSTLHRHVQLTPQPL